MAVTKSKQLGKLPLVVGIFGLGLSPLATAQQTLSPAPGSPYLTDSQGTYAEDVVNDALDVANDIVCYFGNSLIDELATPDGVEYVALIDPNRCTGSGVVQADRQESTTTSARLDRMRVQGRNLSSLDVIGHVYLADDDSDRWDRVWGKVDVTPLGGGQTELVSHIYVDEANGKETTRYSLFKSGNIIAFDYDRNEQEGFEEGKGYREQGAEPDTGNGFVVIDGVEYAFGYNQQYYCRSRNGAEELCFYRDADEGRSSVWEYGLYNPDGSRVSGIDSVLSGTSIRLENQDESGWIDYSGVWFPREQLLNLKDEQTVISDANEEYTLNYIRYRLDEYVNKEPLTPSEIDKVPFWVFDNGDWEFYWDDTQKLFITTGYDPESSLAFRDPSEFSEVQSSYTVEEFAEKFFSVSSPIGGSTYRGTVWDYLRNSDATLKFTSPTNGQLNLTEIVSDSRDRLNTADVQKNTRLEEGSQLYCSGGCPTAADIQTYKNDVDINGVKAIDPWKNMTEFGDEVYTVTYEPVFGLRDENGERIAWPGGIQDEIPGSSGFRIDLKADPADELPSFALELGNGYDSYLLFKDGEPVEFSEPITVAYDVPDSVPDYGGATLNMRAYGSEIDIPGSCYDGITGEKESCDGNSEWRHDFFIPTDPEIGVVRVLSNGQGLNEGDQLLVKWISREVAFGAAPEGVDVGSENITLGTAARMEELITNLDPCNPKESTEECFAGEFPTDAEMFEAPTVIHGERVR